MINNQPVQPSGLRQLAAALAPRIGRSRHPRPPKPFPIAIRRPPRHLCFHEPCRHHVARHHAVLPRRHRVGRIISPRGAQAAPPRPLPRQPVRGRLRRGAARRHPRPHAIAPGHPHPRRPRSGSVLGRFARHGLLFPADSGVPVFHLHRDAGSVCTSHLYSGPYRQERVLDEHGANGACAAVRGDDSGLD